MGGRSSSSGAVHAKSTRGTKPKKATSGGGGSISKTESDAVFDYTTSRYEKINGSLRSGGKMSAKDSATAKSLDSAIGKSNLKAGTTLYRGTSPEAMGISKSIKSMSSKDVKSLVGKTITDKAYVSTSKSKDAANVFSGRGKNSGSVIVTIKTKGSKKGLDVGGNSNFGSKESEVIIPRNAKMKITSARRSLNKLYVEVEY